MNYNVERNGARYGIVFSLRRYVDDLTGKVTHDVYIRPEPAFSEVGIYLGTAAMRSPELIQAIVTATVNTAISMEIPMERIVAFASKSYRAKEASIEGLAKIWDSFWTKSYLSKCECSDDDFTALEMLGWKQLTDAVQPKFRYYNKRVRHGKINQEGFTTDLLTLFTEEGTRMGATNAYDITQNCMGETSMCLGLALKKKPSLMWEYIFAITLVACSLKMDREDYLDLWRKWYADIRDRRIDLAGILANKNILCDLMGEMVMNGEDPNDILPETFRRKMEDTHEEQVRLEKILRKGKDDEDENY